jgi:hypothetical protein
MSTCIVCEQTRQRKKAVFMSGMMGVARMTRPLIEISLSVSGDQGRRVKARSVSAASRP